MSLLLDTHALIWSATVPKRFRASVIAAMQAETVFVSPVSAYEMSLKLTQGKLAIAQRLMADLSGYLEQQHYHVLPVSLAHAEAAGRLSLNHRDPFDRMLAAQALVEELTIVSIDDKLDQFGVQRLW